MAAVSAAGLFMSFMWFMVPVYTLNHGTHGIRRMKGTEEYGEYGKPSCHWGKP